MQNLNKNRFIDQHVDTAVHASEEACHCSPLLQATGSELKLYVDGDELYDAMLDTMTSASQRIQLESYIFSDDEVGRRFLNVLAERSKAGVDVQVHIDAAGSLFFMSRRFEQEMRAAGIRLHWFHKWYWKFPLRYNRRNHRKLLVVDEQIAFVGGFNIHKESSRSVSGNHHWRDTHVSFGGALASQAAQLFDRFWQGDRRWMPPSLPGAGSELLPNYSCQCRRQLHCVFSEMFMNAKQSIYLTTPYFVPDMRTRKLLSNVASRGVDVRLLVPRISDVLFARWASQAVYLELLNNGVKIFEYLPRLLHAKTIVVDANYATVGTANIDYRSYFVNYELNLFTRDPSLCKQLYDQFLLDLESSEEIKLIQWSKRIWLSRLLETAGWFVRKLL